MKPAFTKVEDIIRNLKTHGIEDPGEGITLSPLIVLLLFLLFSHFFFSTGACIKNCRVHPYLAD